MLGGRGFPRRQVNDVVVDAPVFTTQPSMGGVLFEIGDVLTLSEGVATNGATLEIVEFSLDSVDLRSELTGLIWDSSAENIYGEIGLLRLRVRAFNAGGETFAETTAILRDLPDTFLVGQWTLTPDGAGGLNVAILSLPDDGNDAITSIQYRISGGSPIDTGGIVGFQIGGLPNGSTGLEIRAVNSIGQGEWSDLKTETVTGAIQAVPIDSVVMLNQGNGVFSLTVATPSTHPPDGTSQVYAILTPTGQTDPSKLQVRSALNFEGNAPLDSDDFLWTANPTPWTVATGIPQQFVDIHVVIDNGTLSEVASFRNFEMDTVSAILSAVTAIQTGSTTAAWGVTSNDNEGVIYAALRRASDLVLTFDEIENGTGNAVAISQDDTAEADASNGGVFSGLDPSTDYRADVFQRDPFGNPSDVATSSIFTTAAAPVSGLFTEAPQQGQISFGEMIRNFDFSNVNVGDYLACTAAMLGANGADTLSRIELPAGGPFFFAGDDGITAVATGGVEIAGTVVFQVPASLAGNSSVAINLRNTVIDVTTGVLTFANLGSLSTTNHSDTATDTDGTVIDLDLASSVGGKAVATIASDGSGAAFTSSLDDVEALEVTVGPGSGGSVAFGATDSLATTTVIQGTGAANSAGASAVHI